MKKFVFPVIFAVTMGFMFSTTAGFMLSGCGKKGSKAKAEAARLKAQLDHQQAEIKEMGELQAKEADGTITDAEKERLEYLYQHLADGPHPVDPPTPPPPKHCSDKPVPECPSGSKPVCKPAGQGEYAWYCQ